jgi:hypothetical protein
MPGKMDFETKYNAKDAQSFEQNSNGYDGNLN